MKKKKKKQICGKPIKLLIDGKEITSFSPTWVNAASRSATFKPDTSLEDFHKYSDMLYEAWKGLKSMGYKVDINVE